jgi:hypothetical protein
MMMGPLSARGARRRKSGCGGTFIEIGAGRKKNCGLCSLQMRSNIHALMQDANDCDGGGIGFVNNEMGSEGPDEIATPNVIDFPPRLCSIC